MLASVVVREGPDASPERFGTVAPPLDRLTPPSAGDGASDATSEAVVIAGCFGWLHMPARSAAARIGDTAVLLCPALGWDGLHAHHGFRLLADRLACAGYPALRFQYPGTGDSADLPDGTSGHWAGWQDATRHVADWLLAATGARRLVLLGLRFGAAIATEVAATRTDVDGLVLLAPVLRGKSYIRQLDMESRLESGGGGAPSGDGLDLHELSFNAETVRQISALDLRQSKLKAGLAVAMFPQAPSQLVDACAQAWTGAGSRVQCGDFCGMEPLLQEAIHFDPPAPDFTPILTWVRHNFPGGAPAGQATPALPRAVLDLGRCTEQPVRFGPAGALFGILCRPAAGPGRTAVIIPNTGRDPHYGIARFGVELARRLATEGIASLRMDFTGLGDSPAAPGHGDRLSSLFETDRAADIGAAIDALVPMGFEHFAVQGLCSGAFHAFRTAQRDGRIGTLLLVNLPVFEWQGGDSVKTAMWTNAPASRVLQKLMDRETWKRALHGQSDIRSFLLAQARRGWEGVRRRMPLMTPTMPAPQHAMAVLAARHVQSLFLYSPGDPGLDMLEQAFGKQGAALHGCPGAQLHIVPGVDHILSGSRMRATVINLMVTFLAANGRGSTTHDHPFDHPGPDDDRRPPAEADAGAFAR